MNKFNCTFNTTTSKIISLNYPGYWISLIVYFLLNISIYFSYQPNSIDLLLFSILHLLMMHFLIFRFSLLLLNFSKSILHPFSIFILTHIIYFSITHFKYYIKPNYNEFITDLDYRFAGSVLVFISLNILISFCYKIYEKSNYDFFKIFLNEITKKYFYLFTNIFSLSIGSLILFKIYFNPNIINNNFLELLINSYPVFFLLSLFAYIKKKNKLIFFILTSCIVSIFFIVGVRFVIIVSFLTIILFYISFLIKKINNLNKIFNILIYIPLLIILLIHPLTEFSKKIVRNDTIHVINRSDLSDFAISVCLNNNQLSPLYYIANSFKWGIPGFLIDKQNLEFSDETFLKRNGWRSSDYRIKYTLFNVDYPDTLFSTGAFIGGYVGMIAFPVLWIFLFNLIFKRLNNLCFISSYLATMPNMFRIEIASWTLVTVFRNYLILFLFFYLTLTVFRFFSKPGREGTANCSLHNHRLIR